MVLPSSIAVLNSKMATGIPFYEDQHVGSSQRTILNAVLVYYLEDVLVWVFEIDVLDMQSGFCGIFANKIEAFVNEPKCLAVSFIQRIVADMFEFY